MDGRSVRRAALAVALALAPAACGPSSEPAERSQPPGTSPEAPPAAPTVASDGPDGAPADAGRPDLALLPPPDPPPERTPADEEREREIFAGEFSADRARVEDLRRLISLAPERADLHADLGEIYFRLELERLAEIEHLRAVSLDDTLGRSHLVLGEIYRMRSESGRALWHLERARRHRPGDPEVYVTEARSLREVGELELARSRVEAGLARAGEHAELLVARAELGFDLDAPAEEVAADLERAVALAPDHPAAHMLLARAYRALGYDARAAEELEVHNRIRLLRRLRSEIHESIFDPDDPWPEWKRAALLAQQHMWAGEEGLAWKEIERSRALEPGNVDAELYAALIRIRRGERAEGLAELRAAAEAHPGSAAVARALGRELLEADDPAPADLAAARAALERAVALSRGEDAGTWFQLARLERREGRVDAARELLRRALRLEPGFAEARALLDEIERGDA